MYTVLGNKLGSAEYRMLEHIFSALRLVPYKIINVTDENSNIELDGDVIAVYSKTKKKNKFEALLEAKFGTDFESNIMIIDKPSVFMSNTELRDSVLSKLKELNSNKRIQTINKSALPERFPKEFYALLKESEGKTVFWLKHKGNKIEIRPNNTNPSTANSFTYEEFLIIVLSKFVFSYDEIQMVK